ncbi:UDP-N-acetylmuramoyl-tripeptide--D-alanyl-D-alanine ligase [Nocardioides anomalus]|uniref:UDP-N-acetylmuramoyl-tripeptide--D-alanyl-D-alanine ligase n=1 Tax=Nocardioides anomalus TaxID=2712223 RepID=A0A6G6WAF9_9ACTN|nr:UDP-N-acetylmuramoyl-tripeptide--D-alanyl-D-alanine ligase [Nocardioides anomalus]QIG42318.1 UDP-N-acetylmuramoyl-tripeptide--D-alanyl-D-alanine ligase [Nocardioides anomalus]
MIALPLEVVAEIVGGRVEGDGAGVVVDGPVVIDGREAGPGSLFVAFVGERTDGHEHVPQAAEQGAVAVLGTRATGLPTVVVDDAQDALQRLAAHVVAHVRAAGGLTVFALTGSQGKTSTKDLLAAVLGQAGPTVATHGSFNNELGMPLTALRVEPATRYLVLEMGARGIGHLTELTDLVRPDVSLVLNVGTAHVGEFGSRDAIAQAKGELVEALDETGTAVLNADDERVAAMASRTRGRVVTFGTAEDVDVRLEGLELDRLGRPRFTLGGAPVTLQLVGAHQALNAAAAAAAAQVVGVPLADAARTLSAVTGLSKWRMELHELPSGVVLLNDSYNANPESVRAALDALASLGGVRRRIAVLGEMRELGADSEAAHRSVGEYAAERVDELLVVGRAAAAVHAGGGGTLVDDNEAAVAWLRAHLRGGDAVLVKASRGARLDEVAAALA